MSNNKKTIIIGTDRTIKPLSSFWASDEGIFVVSTCGCNSGTAGKGEYFVESCSMLNPKTGSMKDFDFFNNNGDFEQDNLYDDILRFRPTENAVRYFCDTFEGYSLTGSEFAVAFMAYQSEQRGYTPLIIAQPDENNLVEFCKAKNWNYLSLNEPGSIISTDMQNIIGGIISFRGEKEAQIFSSSKST